MKARILVIDDDASLRRVLEYHLSSAGYDTLAASTGEEGLSLFMQSRPDLIITDMNMPGISGLQLLSSVKEQSPEALVIIITAFGSVDVAVEAMKAGAYDYITKPFNRDELLLIVDKALRFAGLTEENRRLKNELAGRSVRTLVGTSPAMEKVFQVVAKVADTDASVLITGESGTGKELVARALHEQSSRRSGPFVTINCAAIPRDLLESELFGHVKGAFTGAVKDKTGKLELADGGTIFLDEVGELPLELQPKLLRVLQEREVEPVGGVKSRKLDLRVVAATNIDIDKSLADGTLREDLYYRLAVIPLHLPPLRERKEDIPLLVRFFCARLGHDQVTFAADAMEALTHYDWPGNVRELENAVERILIMRSGERVTREDIPEKICRRGTVAAPVRVVDLPPEGYPLEQLEREVVEEALRLNQWNQTAAARFLRIPRHTLIYRIEKYGINLPERGGA
jgi:two-component system NtrC family response regulator